MESGGEVTQLLEAMHDGVRATAERLQPLVSSELHRLAKAYMRGERPGHTLQPTALINEAYLRLLGDPMDWKNRAHFIGITANAMRRVLVVREESTFAPILSNMAMLIRHFASPAFHSPFGGSNGARPRS